MANTKLGIEIVADNAKALKGLRQVEEGLKDVSGQAEKTSKKSSGLRDVLGGIAVGAGLKFAIGEFEEAQTSAAQTAAVIKSTGNAAEISAAQQDKMVNSLSKLAAVDDEVVNGGANVLRTFTAVKGEAFEPTLAAALDLSAAMGTDLQSATVMLGKALNDPAAGLSKLTRAGVTFTEQQKEQVKALQESGDMLGAQNVILAEVQKEFGGSAEANATSSAKMKVAFSNAAESLGGSLAPALEATAAVVEKASAAFQSLPAPVQAASGVLVGLAVVGPRIVSGFGKAVDAAQSLRKGLASAAESGSGMLSKFAAYPGAAGAAGIAFVGLGAITAAWADEQARHARRAAELTAAIAGIRQEALSTGQTVEEVFKNTALPDFIGENAKAFKDTGININELNTALQGGDEEWKAYFSAVVQANGGMDSDKGLRLADALSKLRGQLTGARESTAAQTQAQNELGIATDDTSDAVDRQGTAFAGLGSATAQVSGSLDETNQVLSDQAEVLREAEQETRDLTSAALDAFSADLGYQDSLRRTTDATRALTDARREGDPTKVADAERNLNEAIARQVEQKLALAVAEAEANGKQLTATESAKLQRDALDQVRASTGYWNADLEVLRQRLDAAANSAAATAAQLAALALQRSVTNLGGAFSEAFGIGHKAAGGPVTAGRPYVVGDGGRSELFVPSADGTIMPDARKALAGAGATVTLNVHGVTDPMAVAEMASARVARQLRLVSAA